MCENIHCDSVKMYNASGICLISYYDQNLAAVFSKYICGSQKIICVKKYSYVFNDE